jgi:hypothetical protein
MAESTNPVSPKVVWAGIGSLVGPLVLTIVQALLDAVNSGSVVLPEPWQSVLLIATALVGAVVAAYVKNDPRRVTNLTQAQVDELNEPLDA